VRRGGQRRDLLGCMTVASLSGRLMAGRPWKDGRNVGSKSLVQVFVKREDVRKRLVVE
jgi:hypothetical protein